MLTRRMSLGRASNIDPDSLSTLSMLLFNGLMVEAFCGFEVLSEFSGYSGAWRLRSTKTEARMTKKTAMTLLNPRQVHFFDIRDFVIRIFVSHQSIRLFRRR
jgi:hypothetical protein